MRFGIFDHVERRNDVGQAQQYEERLQFAAAADAAGFYCYHLKPLPGGRVDPDEIPRPARIDVDTAFASGALVVGSPATIREYLQRYAAETGANYFVGSFHWGDLSHQEACRSLELFASEAMPAVP